MKNKEKFYADFIKILEEEYTPEELEKLKKNEFTREEINEILERIKAPLMTLILSGEIKISDLF